MGFPIIAPLSQMVFTYGAKGKVFISIFFVIGNPSFLNFSIFI